MKTIQSTCALFLLFFCVSPCFGIGVSELADKLASSKGISAEQAKTEITSVFAVIEEELKAGESVAIRNFGKFSVKERGPRKARNPRTGEEIQVEARKYPRFKASNTLKNSVNGK